LFPSFSVDFAPFTEDYTLTSTHALPPGFYTAADDGLTQPWKGRVWLNPPYGKGIGAWLAKARSAAADGALVVCLVPARPDTRWWRESAAAASLVRFLPGRVKFGADPAPFPSAVVVFGELPGRHGTQPRFCAR
jgi:hypothetical protein